MASFGGAVPAGSLFAGLQSAGAAGISWSSIGSVFTLCALFISQMPHLQNKKFEALFRLGSEIRLFILSCFFSLRKYSA
jgi:hypothetical protein